MRVRVRITAVRLPPTLAASKGDLLDAAKRLCAAHGWPNAWIQPEPDGTVTISRLTAEMGAALQHVAQLRARSVPLQ